jgi:hypothetical protein
MDLCHPSGDALQRILPISPKPHPHNLGKLTPSELLVIGVCGLILSGIIWSVKGSRDE